MRLNKVKKKSLECQVKKGSTAQRFNGAKAEMAEWENRRIDKDCNFSFASLSDPDSYRDLSVPLRLMDLDLSQPQP